MSSKKISPGQNESITGKQDLTEAPSKPRPFGLAKGTFFVSSSFFEPLPDEEIAAFEGEPKF